MSVYTVQDRLAGSWQFAATHSSADFAVKYLVAKFRGTFEELDAKLEDGVLTGSAKVASINVKDANLIGHLQTPDFFDAENHPIATYRSSCLRVEDGDFIVDGALTLRGVTRSVPLTVEVNGFGSDPQNEGGRRAGFTVRGNINRRDFDVNFGGVMNGVTVVGDQVDLTLEVEIFLTPQA